MWTPLVAERYTFIESTSSDKEMIRSILWLPIAHMSFMNQHRQNAQHMYYYNILYNNYTNTPNRSVHTYTHAFIMGRELSIQLKIGLNYIELLSEEASKVTFTLSIDGLITHFLGRNVWLDSFSFYSMRHFLLLMWFGGNWVPDSHQIWLARMTWCKMNLEA